MSIHPTAIIEPGAIISEDVTVGAFAYIAACVIIGPGCVIETHAVIGTEGFSYTRDDNGTLRANPHRFGVILAANVAIGAHTVVDRGSWRNTVIGENTAIDNHVHVGHNVQIGRDCLIVPGVMLGGSTTIGDYCYLGLNACTHHRISIGDRSTLGMGAVLTRDMPADETWVGVPARKLR